MSQRARANCTTCQSGTFFILLRVCWICWLFSTLFRGFPYLHKNHHFKFRFNLENRVQKPIPCKFLSKTLIFFISFTMSIFLWCLRSPLSILSPLALVTLIPVHRNLFSYSCSDHDLFKMAAASVKRFHTTIVHVIFESPQRVTWDFHSY